MIKSIRAKDNPIIGKRGITGISILFKIAGYISFLFKQNKVIA